MINIEIIFWNNLFLYFPKTDDLFTIHNKNKVLIGNKILFGTWVNFIKGLQIKVGEFRRIMGFTSPARFLKPRRY